MLDQESAVLLDSLTYQSERERYSAGKTFIFICEPEHRPHPGA